MCIRGESEDHQEGCDVYVKCMCATSDEYRDNLSATRETVMRIGII